MKKLILLLLIVPIIGLSQSNFYKGYSAGWKKGYCGESYGCIPPVVPTPPSPRSGFNSYEDGYARGLSDGSKSSNNRGSSLSAGQINYQRSGSSEYNKYKDANRYQSGGAAEQRMVGDAVDAAMEENRMRRQRATQSNQYQGSSSYSSYRPPTEAERAESIAEIGRETIRQLKNPKTRKKYKRWTEQNYKKRYLKHKKRYGVDHPELEEFLSNSKKNGFIFENGKIIDIGYPQ
tara:strand:+ start:3070 stop:3768 length:699 start_codon:yes stop_codon:yes gene_type:complete